MFWAPVLLPHKQISPYQILFLCLCFRVGWNVGVPQQSIFNHSFNVSLYFRVTQVGFMREGRLLAEDSPAGFLWRNLWPSTLSIPWIDLIREWSSDWRLLKLSGLLQSHCATSLEGVFLSLCQVAYIIVRKTQDVTKRTMFTEHCSGRNKVLKRGHQHRIHK